MHVRLYSMSTHTYVCVACLGTRSHACVYNSMFHSQKLKPYLMKARMTTQAIKCPGGDSKKQPYNTQTQTHDLTLKFFLDGHSQRVGVRSIDGSSMCLSNATRRHRPSDSSCSSTKQTQAQIITDHSIHVNCESSADVHLAGALAVAFTFPPHSLEPRLRASNHRHLTRHVRVTTCRRRVALSVACP